MKYRIFASIALLAILCATAIITDADLGTKTLSAADAQGSISAPEASTAAPEPFSKLTVN